jgi:hypothetical protein
MRQRKVPSLCSTQAARLRTTTCVAPASSGSSRGSGDAGRHGTAPQHHTAPSARTTQAYRSVSAICTARSGSLWHDPSRHSAPSSQVCPQAPQCSREVARSAWHDGGGGAAGADAGADAGAGAPQPARRSSGTSGVRMGRIESATLGSRLR